MPSPTPERRAVRVREAFGRRPRRSVAISEVERMPGKDAGTEWLAHARDYAMTQHALDQLETASLSFPVDTTDGETSGNHACCTRSSYNCHTGHLIGRAQAWSRLGSVPLIPRASSMKKRLSAGRRCTPAIPSAPDRRRKPPAQAEQAALECQSPPEP